VTERNLVAQTASFLPSPSMVALVEVGDLLGASLAHVDEAASDVEAHGGPLLSADVAEVAHLFPGLLDLAELVPGLPVFLAEQDPVDVRRLALHDTAAPQLNPLHVRRLASLYRSPAISSSLASSSRLSCFLAKW